jgi:hypothetical protein
MQMPHQEGDELMKKQIWFSDGAKYLGSTGFETIRDVAEAMLADSSFRDVFEGNDDPTSLDEAEAYLVQAGMHVDHVPVSVFHQEVWNMDHVLTRVPFDAKPGRGRVRVLGVNL